VAAAIEAVFPLARPHDRRARPADPIPAIGISRIGVAGASSRIAGTANAANPKKPVECAVLDPGGGNAGAQTFGAHILLAKPRGSEHDTRIGKGSRTGLAERDILALEIGERPDRTVGARTTSCSSSGNRLAIARSSLIDPSAAKTPVPAQAQLTISECAIPDSIWPLPIIASSPPSPASPV
jgi:hypothetical protein